MVGLGVRVSLLSVNGIFHTKARESVMQEQACEFHRSEKLGGLGLRCGGQQELRGKTVGEDCIVLSHDGEIRERNEEENQPQRLNRGIAPSKFWDQKN